MDFVTFSLRSSSWNDQIFFVVRNTQTDGQFERVNKIMKDMIKLKGKIVNYEVAYNNSKQLSNWNDTIQTNIWT